MGNCLFTMAAVHVHSLVQDSHHLHHADNGVPPEVRLDVVTQTVPIAGAASVPIAT
jgi:hypothetical protein